MSSCSPISIDKSRHLMILPMWLCCAKADDPGSSVIMHRAKISFTGQTDSDMYRPFPYLFALLVIKREMVMFDSKCTIWQVFCVCCTIIFTMKLWIPDLSVSSVIRLLSVFNRLDTYGPKETKNKLRCNSVWYISTCKTKFTALYGIWHITIS